MNTFIHSRRRAIGSGDISPQVTGPRDKIKGELLALRHFHHKINTIIVTFKNWDATMR